MKRGFLGGVAVAAVVAVAMLAVACGDDDDDGATGDGVGGSLTVYSGRSESLIGSLIEQFEAETGVDVNVKYGDTAELAALLAEEGDRSPADVYLAQDAGALGAVDARGLFITLPGDLLEPVDPRYRASNGSWVGVSGRARVIVYNPDLVPETDLPGSVRGLADARWKDRVGWAPTNGSFQAFVTGFRATEGDSAAEAWLRAMKANGVRDYSDNRSVVAAVASGEIAMGLVNHYYLYGFIKDQGEGFNARNHYTDAGDPGSLVNVAGAGVLASTANRPSAEAFVRFLLSASAQRYFSEATFEYPLVSGIAADPRLKPIEEIDPPDLDLGDLEDLEGTLDLLRDAGVLP